MAELAFFIGKGGVGKTTISSAYAVREAARNPRKKFLLLSTDPAHSLADIFKVKFGDKPQRIRLSLGGQLFAWQINAEKQFRSFLEPYREDLLNLIESGTIFSRSEIEPLLETTLPGMAELSALIAIDELLREGRYDRIIVDTAPIGHTLRMFELPQHFARFLEFLDLAGSRDRWLSQRFSKSGAKSGSQPFLERWQEMVISVGAALTSENSELFMVTSPEEFSLNEAARSADALAGSVPGLAISGIVLNRAVQGKNSCDICASRASMTASAKKFIAKNFPDVPVLVGEDAGNPVLGAGELLKFGEHVFGKKKLAASPAASRAKMPEIETAPWPEITAPLIFTMGKGGVGKTTVSAALGFRQRLETGQPVTVCSTDPAPSLDDVFQSNVSSKPKPVLGDKHFEALEVDSVGEFRAWANAMQDKIAAAFSTQSASGIHVDLSFDRQIFSSLLNIVPPGVDEIFAIFKILDLLRSENKGARRTVIIDMAPTGHALELLRMPERMLMWSRLLLKSLAPHRTLPLAQDVAVEIAGLGQQVRELVNILQDPARSSAFAVMLAEPMPDRETSRLLDTLKELPVSVEAVFVNRILMPVSNKVAARCARCDRARRWQIATLAGLKKRYRGKAGAIYLLPNLPDEIAGKKALQSFTKELWLLA
ncbi:MAG: arsenite efflux ATP-binding protein ArsA [Acidobacteriales bacterium]|nr:arsenite efflux ATP-binding protein ArsA [Terriglobales bacterium]